MSATDDPWEQAAIETVAISHTLRAVCAFVQDALEMFEPTWLRRSSRPLACYRLRSIEKERC
jgi:hypothetical protein